MLNSLVFDPESATAVIVSGKQIENLPPDLYIPPDALQVVLESFSGPLDLLLYLIRKQNLDILNIPIAPITEQYMQYVELMHQFNLELAADYLLMAAILAEIKSRMMLPRPVSEDEEEDPRAELVRRLQEYEIFKHAATQLNEIPLNGRDTFLCQIEPPPLADKPLPQIELQDIMHAFAKVLKRASAFESHRVQREPLSVRTRMVNILSRLKQNEMSKFSELFTPEEGRGGAVVSLLAILELNKERVIEVVQNSIFEEIHIKLLQAYVDVA